jgi:predicted transglutaminase-like cysteine proteinase
LFLPQERDQEILMLRFCALPILVLVFVGFVAAPVSHADYRKLLPAPAGYFKKTQYPQVRERALREFDIGYGQHPSPRVRAWHREISSIPNANQKKHLEHIFAVTNAFITYQAERADVWQTAGETISRGYGDCDDFVAAYLTAAVLLGYRKNELWWVVGYVNTQRGRIGHAIALIVLNDGSAHILDNRARRVIPMSEYFLLDLVYGINVGERAVWTGILVDEEGKPKKAY